MNLEEAITKYELQFDKFNTESQGKLDVVQITERLRQMNPRDYIVVNPFSTVDEIYEILRAVGTAYEISIEYLYTVKDTQKTFFVSFSKRCAWLVEIRLTKEIFSN